MRRQSHRKRVIFTWAVVWIVAVALLLMVLIWAAWRGPVLLTPTLSNETRLPVTGDLVAGMPCRSPIVITSDAEYPPISWQDRSNPDKIVGVAVELVEMAFAEIGIGVDSRYTGPWKRALADAADGKVDLIAGLYLTEEREAVFDYVSPPFVPDPTVIFVMKGSAFPFEQWDDLKGTLGGVRLGDSYGEQFDAFAKDNLHLESVTTFEQLYKMVAAGRIRYMIYGLYPGLAQAEELGVRENLEYLPNFVVSEDIYIAFSRKSSCAIYHEFLGEKLREYVDAKLPEALVEKYVKIWQEQTRLQSLP